MRQLLFICILVFHTLGQAQHQELNSDLNDTNETAIPVVTKPDSNGESTLAFVAADNSKPTELSPDALTIWRSEYLKFQNQQQSTTTDNGVFLNTTKRFPKESLMFFVAIGGVTFNSMWIKSHGDPLALEKHIMSIKDPIAHLSFFAFMQSQGFYTDFFTKRAGPNISDTARKQMMRRLTYQGMAVGSFASSVIADLGQTVVQCTDQWILGKTDEKSLESCNQVWKQWTTRNKFTQYFPQIIAMWASQGVTDFLEKHAHNGFEKVSKTNIAQKILNKPGLKRAVYKITAVDVAATVVGGKIVFKGFNIVGGMTRMTFFVAVDHAMSTYTYRPLNNLIRPILFDFDAYSINKHWAAYDKANWDEAQVLQYELSNTKEKVIKQSVFEKELENFGVQMQQWREHLNADAEGDLAGWMELTKEVLNQMDYAYKYYKGFVDNLFQTLNIGHQIKNGALEPSAATVISRYPLRTLPFYGVGTGPYQAVKAKVDDLYILDINNLEKVQKQHVLNISKHFNEVKKLLYGKELEKLNSILDKLSSGDDKKMSVGLNEINQIVSAEEMTDSQNNYRRYSVDFNEVIEILRKSLGDPLPVVYPFAGYSQAFAAHGVNQVVSEASDFSKWSYTKKYKFNKEADLMFYNILCGNSKAGIYRLELINNENVKKVSSWVAAKFNDVNWIMPEFVPPTLIKNSQLTYNYCNTAKSTNTLYSEKIKNENLHDFVLANIDYSIVGEFRDSTAKSAFEKWWVKSAKEPMNAEFKILDAKFKDLTNLAYSNFFGEKSLWKRVADGLNQSKYLPKNMQASLKFETNLYLQIISRALTTNINTPLKSGFYNYVEFAVKNSETQNYLSPYANPIKEISVLNGLLDSYPMLIKQKEVNFEMYIKHSKKIDTAINDVLVLAGLKKIILTTSKDDEVEDLGGSSEKTILADSGNENTQNTYEDIALKDITYRQRTIIAAVKGLRQVESEIRRFIRMKIVLSQSLELDSKEFMQDWNNANTSQLSNTKTKSATGVFSGGAK